MSHFSGVIALIILFTALLWFTVGWWVSSIERAKQQRNRETDWNHQLNTLRRDRDAFRDQVEIAHGKIRVLESRRADGSSPPRSPEAEAASEELTTRLQAHLEQAKQQISGFAQKVEALHEQSIEREDVLEKLKKKLTDTSRTLHDREQKLAEISSQSATSAPLHIISQDESASEEQTRELEETVKRLRIELQTQTDTAAQDRLRLDHTIGEHMQTISALRTELAQREAQSSDSEASESELTQIRQKLTELKHENQNHVQKIEQLSQGSKVVEHQRSRLKTLQTDFDEQQIALKELTRTASSNEQKLRELASLQERSRSQEAKIEQLTAARSALEAERDQAKKQLESQREELYRQDEARTLRQHGELTDTIEQHELTISRLQQQAITREQQYDSELLQMREAMDAQEHIVTQLRDVLAKPTSTAPPAPRTAPVSPAPTAGTPPQSGDLFAQIDHQQRQTQNSHTPSVRLYNASPASRDDLKKINGIGPAFERALNKLGLFEFEQIAALNDGDIEWVAQSLRSFPDRIVKGNWIEQAQRLISERR